MELEMFMDSVELSMPVTGIYVLYLFWITLIFTMLATVQWQRKIQNAPNNYLFAACVLGSFGFYLSMSMELYRPFVHVAFLALVITSLINAAQVISARMIWHDNSVYENSSIEITERASRLGYIKDVCLGVAIACLGVMHDLDDGFVPILVMVLFVMAFNAIITRKYSILFLGRNKTQVGLVNYHASHTLALGFGAVVTMIVGILFGETTAISAAISTLLFVACLVSRLMCVKIQKKAIRHQNAFS